MSITKIIKEGLVNDEFIDIGKDISEIIVDDFIEEGLLKELPIVKTISAAIKTTNTIREAIFIKKLILFLKEVHEIGESERKKLIEETEQRVAKSSNLFEKILSTLDKLDEIEKAEFIGRAFKHLIRDEITLLEFNRISKVVQDIVADDLKYFIVRNLSPSQQDDKLKEWQENSKNIRSDHHKRNMINKGLITVTTKLEYRENVKNKKYSLKEKESKSRTANLLIEMYFNRGLYFKKPKNYKPPSIYFEEE